MKRRGGYIAGKERRGRGYVAGRMRKGRGFFKTVKNIAGKVWRFANSPTGRNLIKTGINAARTLAETGMGMRRGGVIRRRLVKIRNHRRRLPSKKRFMREKGMGIKRGGAMLDQSSLNIGPVP